MPLTLTMLKYMPQNLWLAEKAVDPNDPNSKPDPLGFSSAGICYSMCEYVRLKIWDKDNVKSLQDAIKAAGKAVPKTIVDAGKAKNLRDYDENIPQDDYLKGPKPVLRPKSVYRIGLWFGEIDEAPVGKVQNHEVLAITGNNNTSDVIFFEPNFGFYSASFNGKDQKLVLETAINSSYKGNIQPVNQKTAVSPDPTQTATNIHYKLERSF